MSSTCDVYHAPKFGATVASFDAGAARKIPGVVDVFQIPTGVAVVADNTWAARKGRDALAVKWDFAKAETRGSDQMKAEWTKLAGGPAPEGSKLKWFPFETRGEPADFRQGDPRATDP